RGKGSEQGSGVTHTETQVNAGSQVTLSPIFDKEKEQNRLQEAQLIGEIGSQAADIARTEGQIAGEKAKRDPAALQAAKEALAGKGNLNPTADQIAEEAYNTAMAPFGTGSALQKGMQAATAAVQGLAGGNIGQAVSGAAAPYLAEQIHKLTEGNPEAKAMAHAVLGAVTSYASGNSALAGAAGGVSGELMAQLVMKQLYPGKAVGDLTETEKQTISALGTLAAGLAGGVTGDSTAGAVAGAQAGRNAVENNYLSNAQKAQKTTELAECHTVACKAQTQAKWTAIDLGQDGSFAAGMIAGVPAGLYDAVDGIVKTASSPVETYEALKTLFNSGDVLGNVSDAVKQSYIDRINRMEVEYQKAGASGSFNAGVEGGKLVTDIAGLLAGGAGVVKGGALLTEKVVAKAAGKAESAAAGFIGNEAHSATNYAGLKLDLRTTEAANDVVDSLRTTGRLPSNYVNKAQAAANGWKPGKALNNTNPGGQLGGDIFENSNNLLPSSPGRVWREADIGLNNTMSRSNQPGTRLLYSSDGLLYITTDHYETATSIGKWK
ncbi:VENN motif pre-toxin domain-containing protein, partial [Pantoea sp. RRHST58]|uniref:VENN motif pre-toxin domain-containing protein n=1 Tax=Pantoea sp. RRHST58 TaxID=3425183 RepID=UPI003D9FC4E9